MCSDVYLVNGNNMKQNNKKIAIFLTLYNAIQKRLLLHHPIKMNQKIIIIEALS